MRFQKVSLLALALLSSTAALAGPSPQTGSFDVTADVPRSCRVVSTTDLAFGNYDPSDVNAVTPLDTTGSLSIRCVRGVVADVALDQGLNPAAGSTAAAPLRRMADGAEFLRYDIFQDATYATAWGGTAATDRTFTSVAANVDTVLTTYGRIPAGQDVVEGSYLDTVTVTVTF